MKPIRYYIATRLENAAQHNRVRDLLADMGHYLTYDWTAHGSVQDEGVERMAEVAGSEAGGVNAADLVVVLLPGGRGTHTELGMAIAHGKKVLIYAAKPEDMGERHCAFYHIGSAFKCTVRVVHGDLADLLVAFDRIARGAL